VLHRSVAEPILNPSRVVADVGQGVAAAVAEHVRVDLKGEAGARANPLDQAIDGIERKRAAALRAACELLA
jgi:hypothetical protein